MHGTPLRTFGTTGSGPGQFRWLTHVAIDRANNILVCDSDNRRVQILTAQGVFITEFRTDNDKEDIYSLTVDCEGRIVCGGNGLVFVFAFEA